VAWRDDVGTLSPVSSFVADGFSSFTEALMQLCRDADRAPKTAVMAVAGPVQSDEVHFTNRDWAFSQPELKSKLGLSALEVMNDFAALALSLPHLSEEDVERVAKGIPQGRAPMVVLGPGTGLGVATAVPQHESWVAVPGEGGHVAASLDHLVPPNAQARLWADGWLPWEDVLSGRGLVRLHRALHPDRSVEAPEDVTAVAREGDEAARRTLSVFAALLGRRASDAALQTGAWGGVYLAGGILPQLGDLFYRAAFRHAFETKGVYTDLVRKIPISLITRPDPAFLGLQATVARLT